MSWIPGFLRTNWKLKLASLCLAVLLWTSLRVEAVDRQVLPSVPVRVQLNDPQWAVRSDPDPPTVEVQFSGPANELLGLYLERPTVTIPVDAVSAADTSILLRPEWVRLPDRPDVSVEAIRPTQVALSFDPINQAVAPVTLRTEGSLSENLALADPITVEPEVVRMSGPASQLEQVDSVPLGPLDLSEVEGSGSRMLPVDTAGLYGLVISPGRVRVSYAVGPRVERILEGVQVSLPSQEAGVSVDPASTSVTLRGARTVIQGVDPASVRVQVLAGDLQGLAPGESRSVAVEVRGVPALVEAESAVSEVTVARAEASSP